MFSPGSLAILNPFIYRRQLESEMLFNTEECYEHEKTKKNCDCSEDKIEVGVNLPQDKIHSDIIHDGLTFGSQTNIKLSSEMIDRFKQITAETYQEDK